MKTFYIAHTRLSIEPIYRYMYMPDPIVPNQAFSLLTPSSLIEKETPASLESRCVVPVMSSVRSARSLASEADPVRPRRFCSEKQS
jgi:hypothetical protein